MKRPLFVVGAGSVGTFLSAILSPFSDVTLIARERSVERFARGVLLEGAVGGNYNFRCVSWHDLEEFPSRSVILLTTKVFQLANVLPEIGPRLSKDCTLVLCQNGLGVVDEAEKILPGHSWARAVCWFGARLLAKPDIPASVMVGGIGNIELAGGNQEAIIELKETLEAAGIPIQLFSSMSDVEWRKALWNISANGVLALAGATNGEMLDNPILRSLVEKVLEETAAVARADGFSLTQADLDRVFISARKVAANLNSTLQDLNAGRPTEMPWLNGQIVERGRRLGIPTPYNFLIESLVQYRTKSF